MSGIIQPQRGVKTTDGGVTPGNDSQSKETLKG